MDPERPREIINSHIETLEADKPFEVEITGPPSADTAVILVHGFGVKRDSRGMFTDIEAQIRNTMLSVRGEFSDVQQDKTRAIPFSAQAKRLQTITAFTMQKYNPKNIVYIGHSQGNFVIAEAKPNNSQAFLLAPPIGYEKFVKTPGWSKPGSHFDPQAQSRLVRSDLTVEVAPEFWREFERVNPNSLYLELAKNNQVEIITAEEDKELGSQELPTEIPRIVIPKANHDFKDASRSELIQAILRDIKR